MILQASTQSIHPQHQEPNRRTISESICITFHRSIKAGRSPEFRFISSSVSDWIDTQSDLSCSELFRIETPIRKNFSLKRS